MKKTTFKSTVALVLVAALCVLSLSACGKTTITLTDYADELDFHTSEQTAYLADYKSVGALAVGTEEKSVPLPVTLSWTDTAESVSYTVAISENSDMSASKTFLCDELSIGIYNLKIATKYYWQVSSEKSKSLVGTFSMSSANVRNLYVDGVTNVRDVGGWMTASGKRMAQGLLYRGGRLNVSDPDANGYKTISTYIRQITDQGIDTFTHDLGIKTEIDFRLLTRNGFPSSMTPTSPAGVDYVALPLNGSDVLKDASSLQNIKELMTYLANSDNYPVFYHCNIGTDRTGCISYLLQALCGVSEEDLMTDYFFSNFGNIGDFKDPDAAHSVLKIYYVDYLAAGGQYEGDTLSQRVISFFLSIGVESQTIYSVRSILMGD